jgi:hypothetical protein
LLEVGYKIFFKTKPTEIFLFFCEFKQAQADLVQYLKDLLTLLPKTPQNEYDSNACLLFLRSSFHVYSLEPPSCISILFVEKTCNQDFFIYYTPTNHDAFFSKDFFN